MHATAGPVLAHQQPLPADLLLQRSVMGWIDTIQRCPQHRNGCTFSGQTAAMSCSINPFRKTTKDGPTCLGERTAQFFSHCKAMVRSGAGAHHRDGCSGIDMPKQRSISFNVQTGKGVSSYPPSCMARQGHPATAHRQAHQASEQPRARACNSLRRANSAPAKPGQQFQSHHPRTSPEQVHVY